MKQGIKHLVECHCILPQYKDAKKPVYHKFVVFSVIDEHDSVVIKHAQCTNCGVIHRVYDISRSEAVLGNDETTSVITIDDIQYSIPQRVAEVLKSYEVDLPTWEEVAFIIENKIWNKKLILTKEATEIGKQGKTIRFLSADSFRIEPYSFQNVIA